MTCNVTLRGTDGTVCMGYQREHNVCDWLGYVIAILRMMMRGTDGTVHRVNQRAYDIHSSACPFIIACVRQPH